MGVYPSVRIPFGCPIRLALGQDESNYNSEVASSRHWTVNGFFHMTPKSGVGLMVSGFTSGALGFGLPLTPEELAKVNAYRLLPENSAYKCAKFGAPQALCALGKVLESDQKCRC